MMIDMAALVGRFVRIAPLFFALALAACDSPEERVEKHYARGMALLEEGEPERATLEFRNALKIDGNHAPSRYEIARRYEADRALEAALGNYRLVTELDPTHVEARVKLAQLMLLAGRVTDAAAFTDQAMALAPENLDVLSVAAAVAFREGDMDEAVRLASEAVARDPAHLGANIVLISERVAAGEVDEALRRLDPLLTANSGDFSVNGLKLRLLQQQGDAAALRAHLETMIDRFPEQTSLRQALAQLHLQRGDQAAALAVMREMTAADPSNVDLAIEVVRFIGGVEGVDAARVELDAMIAAAGSPAQAFPLQAARADIDYQSGETEAAKARIEAVIEGDVDVDTRRAAQVKLARYRLIESDRDGAAALVATVLEADDRNAEALGLRARISLLDNRPEAAILDLRTALDVDPDNTDLMLLEARAHELNGSSDVAGERLGEAMRTSDFAPAVTLTYAQFLQNRSQPEAAEGVLLESLRRNSDNPELLMRLAELRIARQDWEGADAIAQTLLSLEASDAAARVQAASLGAQGNLNASIDILQKIAADPDQNQAAMAGLVVAYVRNGEPDKAIAYVEKELARDPGNLRALLLRAELHLMRDNAPAAEAALTRMIDSAPDNSAGYISLARLQAVLGRPDEAIATLDAGVSRVENADALHFLLAHLHEQRGDFDAAIAQYEALLEQGGAGLIVVNNLASLIAEFRADDPEAIARAAMLSRRLRSSDVPEFQDTYGWIQFLNGESRTALRSVVMAAEALPTNALVQYHAGRVYADLEQFADARRHLETALSLDPNFPKAASAREALAALPAEGAGQ